MKLKPLVLGVCMATLGAMSVPMTASAAVAVYFDAAPPPARYEAVPPPRHGYVWVPGYWNVHHKKHVWQKGHWERARAGYRYVEPHWTEEGNRWQLHAGQWQRGDSDHDGVANAYDRAPNNPLRQ
jgi:hypothetical protein